jgi:fibronectin-binding autotransporter adhesin
MITKKLNGHSVARWPASCWLGFSLLVTLAFFPVAARAELVTKADNTTALDLGGSWEGGVAPGVSDTAVFDDIFQQAGNIGFSGTPVAWGGIEVRGSSVTSLINIDNGSGGRLDLGAGGIEMEAAPRDLSIRSLDVTASQAWDVGSGRTLTVGSNLFSGSSGVTKLGAGTLTIAGGTAAYTGSLTIREGIVQVSNGASLANGSGITIQGGGAAVGGANYPFLGAIRSGTLLLRDDSGSPGGNQLGSQTVALENGTVLWQSGGGADATTISDLTLAAGFNTVAVAPVSNPDVLTITDLTRSAGATVEFRAMYAPMGTGEVQIRPTNVNSAPIANTNGILGGWAFVAANSGVGNYGGPARSFAAWDPAATIGVETGSIVAATPDKSNGTGGATTDGQDIATGTSTENWLINDSGSNNAISSGTVTINSLIEERDLFINNGSTLVVESGGVIFRNTNFWMQTNAGATGFLTSGTNDLYLQTDGGVGDQRIRVIMTDGDAGAVTLRKSGPGRLRLDQINTFTGGTVVNQGTLDLGTGGANGAIRGSVTVNAGGTLRLNAGDATGWAGGSQAVTAIDLNGGTLDVNTSGANQTLGGAAVTMTGGTISGVSGSNLAFYSSGGGTSSLTTLASSTASVISIPQISLRQVAGVTFTVAAGTTSSGIDLDVSAVIASGVGDNGPLIKAGPGVMRLSGASTYNQGTTISGGTLVIDAGGRIYSGSYQPTAVLTVGSGATLDLQSWAYGETTQSLGGLRAATDAVVVDGGTIRISGSTPTAYGRGVTVQSGGIRLEAAAGADWTLNTTDGAADNWSFSGNPSVTLAGDGTGSLEKILSLGSGGLTKAGSGTWTLTAANTFTGGTSINAGTLIAGSANALGTSGSITIGASGTLGVAAGVAFSRPLTITAGGKVSLGDGASVALPDAAALSTFESTSTAGAATTAEILFGSGSTTPSALTSGWLAQPAGSFSDILSLDGTGTGNVYVLSMSYDGAAPDPTGLNIGYRAGTTGAFTNVGTSSQGSVPWNSGFTTVGQYGVDTTSGTVWVVTDHNSQFVVVPEPAVGLAAAAGCAGIVAGLWRRRRRG